MPAILLKIFFGDPKKTATKRKPFLGAHLVVVEVFFRHQKPLSSLCRLQKDLGSTKVLK